MKKEQLEQINDALIDYLPYEIDETYIIETIKNLTLSGSKFYDKLPWKLNKEAMYDRLEIVELMKDAIKDEYGNYTSTLDAMNKTIEVMKSHPHHQKCKNQLNFIRDYFKEYGQEDPNFNMLENLKTRANSEIKEHLSSIMNSQTVHDITLNKQEKAFLKEIYKKEVPTYDFNFLKLIIPRYNETTTNPMYSLRKLDLKTLDYEILKPVFKEYSLFAHNHKDGQTLDHFRKILKKFPLKEEMKTNLYHKAEIVNDKLNEMVKEYQSDISNIRLEHLEEDKKKLLEKYGRIPKTRTIKKAIVDELLTKWYKTKDENSDLIEFIANDYETHKENIQHFDIVKYCDEFNNCYPNIDLSKLYIYEDAPKKLQPALLCGLIPEIFPFDIFTLYVERARNNSSSEYKKTINEYFPDNINNYEELLKNNWPRLKSYIKNEKSKEIITKKQIKNTLATLEERSKYINTNQSVKLKTKKEEN